MTISHDIAHELLNQTFQTVENEIFDGSTPTVTPEIKTAFDRIFASTTQAYRETLLGCLVAKIQDTEINIRQPYVDQGPHAFSGRSLDERVINPFLRSKRIPISNGPYLSVFRRSVQFDSRTRDGLRDKEGYDAFLTILDVIESNPERAKLILLLQYILFRFVQLREESVVPLSRIQRISLEQYGVLISGLLSTPSGGRFPVFLVVAIFRTVKTVFNLDWEISYQGINVADKASGAGGDITIRSNGEIFLAAEVTERTIDQSRVLTTFNTKIASSGIKDYLFFVKPSNVTSEARTQAHQYFAQGHEVNFLEIKDWIVNCLALVGTEGRVVFNKNLLELLDSTDIPKALKVAWNDQIQNITKT